MCPRVGAHAQVLVQRAEVRVDLQHDAVEVAVDGGRELASADAAGPFHGAGVQAVDADVGQRAPERFIAQRSAAPIRPAAS